LSSVSAHSAFEHRIVVMGQMLKGRDDGPVATVAQ